MNDNVIPNDNDVATPSGGRLPWRVADGHICRGREQDGTYETRPKLLGRLQRIGIYSGVAKSDNTPYTQIEADLETANEGTVRVKVGVSDKGGNIKPSVAALTFAEGLMEIRLGEIACLTATQSQKETKYGNKVTYSNWWHVDTTARDAALAAGKSGADLPTARTVAVKRPESDRSKTMDQRWADLVAQIEKHPAFAERPASETDDESGNANTHLSALCKECEERGWPTPEQAPVEWLAMVAKAYGHEARARLSDYGDDEWGEVRLTVSKIQIMPPSLAAAKARITPEPKQETMAGAFV